MNDDLQETLENAAIYGAIQRGNQQRAQQMRPQGPPCPYCGGPIPMRGATICMHCRSKLKGDEHVIYEAEVRSATKKWESEQRENAKGELLRMLIIFGPLITIGILIVWISLLFRDGKAQEFWRIFAG